MSGQYGGRQVSGAVAEDIDHGDVGAPAIGGLFGLWHGQAYRVSDSRSHFRQRDAVGEVSSNRSKDIASVESAADIRQEVFLICQLDDCLPANRSFLHPRAWV